MQLKPSRIRRGALVGLALLSGLVAWVGLSGDSRAAESRDVVVIQARILQDGAPVEADLDLTFELYDAASGGQLLYSESQTGVEVRGGILSTQLGNTQSLAGIFDDGAAASTDRYCAIKLAGVEIVPRIRLTAVPYAHNASTAAIASKLWNATTSTAIDLADLAGELAGAGLEDDGSGNLRVAAAAAGDGLTGGGGSALSVVAADLAGSGLEASGGDLRLAAAAAGNGLTGGAGSALTIQPDTTTGGDTAPVLVTSAGVGVVVGSLDGDHLHVDFTPSNYTPSTAPAEAADVDDLTAHLKGIDSALTGGGGGGGTTLPAIAGGRLTLSGTLSVTLADTTSGTLYYLPHPAAGDQVALHDGSSTWSYHTIPPGGVTAVSGSLSSDTSYDVFLYDDSSVLTLELQAWDTDLLRYGTAELEEQDGVYVKEGSTTRRYLGTVRTISSSGTKFTDAVGERYVWNYSNRVPVSDFSNETSSSWSVVMSAGVYKKINAKATLPWRHRFVIGVDDRPIAALTLVHSEGKYAHTVILDGEDDDSADLTRSSTGVGQVASSGVTTTVGTFQGHPTIGHHHVQGVNTRWDSVSGIQGFSTLSRSYLAAGMRFVSWR